MPSPSAAVTAGKAGSEPPTPLATRLLPGGVVLVSAILVTIMDQLYSKVSGEIFTIGGLRTSVVAGLLMLIGVGLCLYRLKRD